MLEREIEITGRTRATIALVLALGALLGGCDPDPEDDATGATGTTTSASDSSSASGSTSTSSAGGSSSSSGSSTSSGGATCMPDTCGTHGTCDDASGAPVCACDDGWYGSTCDACAFRVDPAATGIGDGATWHDAFTSIQPAIDAAATMSPEACDVWIAEGTYYVYATAKTDTIRMADHVSLRGGFSGTETIPEHADPVAHPTVLSGRQSASSANRVEHVVTADGVRGTLDGLTIRDGGGSASAWFGAGIIVESKLGPTELTMSRSELTENVAAADGGAIHARATAPYTIALTVEDSSLHDNVAGSRGSGIFCQAARCAVRRSRFRANGSLDFYAFGEAVVLADDEFADGNYPVQISGQGPGGPTTVLENLRFERNDGAALGLFDGSFEIRNGLFLSSLWALELHDTVGSVTLVNSTIVGSYIAIYQGNPLTNVTVRNSIIALGGELGNTYPALKDTVVVDHSNVQGWGNQPALGNIDVDPLFVSVPKTFDVDLSDPLSSTSVTVFHPEFYAVGHILEIAHDGVPRTVTQIASKKISFTPAITAPLTYGREIRNWRSAFGSIDLHTLPASPCHNAADPAAATSADIDGAPRDATPDMGAYEHP